MKTALVVILVAASAFAQNTTAPAHVEAACGPLGVQFDTKLYAGQPAAQPEPGKALVYVVEDFRAKTLGMNPTVRIGMDGVWLGATRPSSYLSFAAKPGEHHLCINWQSSLQRFSQLLAFAGFTAEAGQVYYYRERISYSGFGGSDSPGAAMDLDLDSLNPDEGQYLVGSYQLSTSHPKK
jgi:hypothetical protein